MWSPLRARKIDDKGLLKPFVKFEYFGDPKKLNCIETLKVMFGSLMGIFNSKMASENMKDGLLPQKWMGKNIYPFKQEGAFDIDYEWQLESLKYWNKKFN